MPTPMMLKANGFTLTLDPVSQAPMPDDAYFTGTLSIRTTLGTQVQEFRREANFPASDLACLCDWINTHINTLIVRGSGDVVGDIVRGRFVESPTWVPLDLSMQIGCLDGEVDMENGTPSGNFSILVLLNIGKERADGTNVYAGFEATVDVQAVSAFCNALRAYVSSFRRG